MYEMYSESTFHVYIYLLIVLIMLEADLRPKKNANNLPEEFRSVSDLLAYLGISNQKYFFYARNSNKTYSTFSLETASKKLRTIHAPTDDLKEVQRKLLAVLERAYIPLYPVNGYVKGASIVTNAARHVKKRWVLNFDIESFFPSITRRRIIGLLASKRYSIPRPVAICIASLTTYKDMLPQGAPTSPIISNMICGRMDVRLRNLAKEIHADYTRYADDITFSTTHRALEKLVYEDATGLQLREDIARIIEEEGFFIQTKKTRIANHYQRQSVTGIKVNQITNVERSRVREVRHLLHLWQKQSEQSAQAKFHAFHHTNKNLREYIHGQLAFIKMVRSNSNKIDPVYSKLLEQYKYLTVPNYHRDYTDQCKIFVKQISDICNIASKQTAGYALEKVVADIAQADGILVCGPKVAADGTAQFDGHIRVAGHNYLIECKYLNSPIGAPDLTQFLGKLALTSNGTRGIFISKSTFRSTVDEMLKRTKGDTGIIVLELEELKDHLEKCGKLSDLVSTKWDELVTT